MQPGHRVGQNFIHPKDNLPIQSIRSRHNATKISGIDRRPGHQSATLSERIQQALCRKSREISIRGTQRKPMLQCRCAAWRSVGWGTVSQVSQARTWRHALSIGSGRSNTLGLVTRRRNASKLTQGSPTRVEPLSCWSSQSRADLCCANDSTCE